MQGRIGLRPIREWLALNQWDGVDSATKRLVDELDSAIVYLEDGYIDDESFRQWLIVLLDQYTTVTTTVQVGRSHSVAPAVVRSEGTASHSPTVCTWVAAD